MAYAITTTVTASGLWSLVTLVSGDSGEKMIFFFKYTIGTTADLLDIRPSAFKRKERE
jgi:hypothetical protein